MTSLQKVSILLSKSTHLLKLAVYSIFITSKEFRRLLHITKEINTFKGVKRRPPEQLADHDNDVARPKRSKNDGGSQNDTAEVTHNSSCLVPSGDRLLFRRDPEPFVAWCWRTSCATHTWKCVSPPTSITWRGETVRERVPFWRRWSSGWAERPASQTEEITWKVRTLRDRYNRYLSQFSLETLSLTTSRRNRDRFWNCWKVIDRRGFKYCSVV